MFSSFVENTKNITEMCYFGNIKRIFLAIKFTVLDVRK